MSFPHGWLPDLKNHGRHTKMDVAREIRKVAHLLQAKKRPDTLYEQAVFDAREFLNDKKKELASKAIEGVSKKMRDDLSGKGFKVISMEPSLGKFRGSYFLTSCKLSIAVPASTVENDPKLQNLVNYLKATYSPKFKIKGVNNGVALFNVR